MYFNTSGFYGSNCSMWIHYRSVHKWVNNSKIEFHRLKGTFDNTIRINFVYTLTQLPRDSFITITANHFSNFLISFRTYIVLSFMWKLSRILIFYIRNLKIEHSISVFCFFYKHWSRSEYNETDSMHAVKQ